ncbi:MAG: hypothetical protein LBG94_00590 [Treponema sp.]|jgi:uncharacterized protein YjgD (DUF1641 family)|nr:hypothetical protein [Treponema sp.]
MKKYVILLLLLGLAAAAFAQNYSEVEQQINQSIQANAAEFDRLMALLTRTTNERELAQLVRSFNSRQTEIKTLQREIDEMINRPATRQAIDVKMSRLQDLMNAEKRFLTRLNELRN